MPKADFLLYSFEGSIILTYSAEQIFIGDNEAYGNLIELIRRR